MRFDLDAQSGDLYEQIAAAIRRSIHEGQYSSGDRLPPARELADGLGVNFHTVRRAFAVLVAEGTIEMRRGRGATVTADATQLNAVALTAEFVAAARRLGYGAGEIRRFVDGALT